jgi:hypothetical protein
LLFDFQHYNLPINRCGLTRDTVVHTDVAGEKIAGDLR